MADSLAAFRLDGKVAAITGGARGIGRAAAARHGGVDILVNNAGIGLRHAAVDHPLADWARRHTLPVDGGFLAV